MMGWGAPNDNPGSPTPPMILLPKHKGRGAIAATAKLSHMKQW